MYPPDPLPPGSGPASPAVIIAALTRELARHGIAGVYTATAEKFAVISVAAGLTVWTDGRRLWCTHDGQRHTWPAADIPAAATGS